MGLERISHNHLSEGRPAGRAYPAGPFLTVGLLTLSAAARLFLKVSPLNMKLLLKLIFVAGGIFMTVNSLTLNQDARNQTSAISSSAVLVAPTEALYKQKCSKCHGADGSGGTSMGRIFNAPDFIDGGWWTKTSKRRTRFGDHAGQEEHARVWEKVNQGADSRSRRLRPEI
jgi:mono/diheme cytochrome c family protein